MQVDLTKSIHRWTLRDKLRRAAWIVTWGLLGKRGPRRFSRWRVFLLRSFGAVIGRRCLISSNVEVLMPWNLRLGDFVAVAERVNFYNFDVITVGSQTVISQDVMLCTGTHDYTHPQHPLTWKAINIGFQNWICTKAFIAPGVSVGDGSVIGACAVVTKDMPAWMVCAGNPCIPLKARILI